MRRTLPLLTAGAAATLALAVAGPATASVAQIGPDGYLDVTETTPGEQNDLYIKVLPAGGVNVIAISDLGHVTPGPGCWTAGSGDVECNDPPQTMRISLGGGDDKFGVSEGGTSLTFSGGVVADLGPGNDTYDASATSATITVLGGEGNDLMEGSQRTDHLDGGPGDDRLQGNQGADDLHGGAGDDELVGDRGSDTGIFADVLDGGPGRDRLRDYVFDGDPAQAPAINVSLDGVANDGRSGENDNVTDMEVFEPWSAGSFTGSDGDDEFTAPEVGAAGTLAGRGGNDTLIAGDANGDTVDGGAGDDLVEGGFGDDRLVGGPGRDRVNGDRGARCNEYHCDYLVTGNDVIEVRDGEADSVACGPGTDKVVADAVDTVAPDCETVERAAAGGAIPSPPPPAGGAKKQPVKRVGLSVVGSVKLGAALKRGFKVRVTNVKGTVKAKATRKGKVMAKGSARAKGGKATVTLKFTAKARKTLRRARAVSLRISVAGTTRVVRLKR
jgi:hypothetical protein